MKKFENYCSALENLKEIYNYKEPYGTVELTGLVGLYEICFEQAWKAMKEILYLNGFQEAQMGSPRQILKTAFQENLIKNEELWLEALASRNNVAHAYNKDIANDIVKQTKNKYYHMFCELKLEVEENWQ